MPVLFSFHRIPPAGASRASTRSIAPTALVPAPLPSFTSTRRCVSFRLRRAVFTTLSESLTRVHSRAQRAVYRAGYRAGRIARAHSPRSQRAARFHCQSRCSCRILALPRATSPSFRGSSVGRCFAGDRDGLSAFPASRDFVGLPAREINAPQYRYQPLVPCGLVRYCSGGILNGVPDGCVYNPCRLPSRVSARRVQEPVGVEDPEAAAHVPEDPRAVVRVSRGCLAGPARFARRDAAR